MCDTRAKIVAAALLGVCATLSSGQSTPPAPTPPPAPAATPPEKDKPADEPSLDDLLGLPKTEPAKPAPDKADPAKPADPLADPKQSELDRKLSDAEAQEKFKEAIRQMGETAERLEKARDTGLTTQRLQEEIIRKLDALIKHQQQQQGGGSSSSSSSSSDPSQQQGQQPQQPQQGGQKGEQSKGGAGDQAGTPPAKEDAKFNNRLDAARAAWGALPQRLREAFTQGMDDYYSRLYQGMTEEYYRKTAESAGP